MSRSRAKDLLPLIEAYANGATIQVKSRYEPEWVDDDDPTWTTGFAYRIKGARHEQD